MKLILVAFWMTVEASTQTVYFIIFDYISIQSLRIKPKKFLSSKEMKKLKHSSFYFFGDKKEKSLIEFFNLKRFRKKTEKVFLLIRFPKESQMCRSKRLVVAWPWLRDSNERDRPKFSLLLLFQASSNLILLRFLCLKLRVNWVTFISRCSQQTPILNS